MNRQKHVPQRTCVVCRKKGDKRLFTRLVRTDDGVQIDPTGRLAGRGAYVCDDPTCWERASASEIISKALKTSLSPDDRQRIRLHVS